MHMIRKVDIFVLGIKIKNLDKILNNQKIGYILVRCNTKQQHLIERRIGERMISELARPIEYNQWSKSNI